VLAIAKLADIPTSAPHTSIFSMARSRVGIHNTSFSSKLGNWPNELECSSLASLSNCVIEQSSLFGQFVSYKENGEL